MVKGENKEKYANLAFYIGVELDELRDLNQWGDNAI